MQSSENILGVLWQLVQMLIIEAIDNNCILEDIQKDSDFVNDMGMDSLSFVELIMTCESIFDIVISVETCLKLELPGICI